MHPTLILNIHFFGGLRGLQCSGYLDWMEIPGDRTVDNITVPTNDVYQFAVAADSWNISSGMVWSTCTRMHNNGDWRNVLHCSQDR